MDTADGQATISFTTAPDAPTDVTYTVSATPVLNFIDDPFRNAFIPNGVPVVAPAATRSPVVVHGLTNGIAYEFAVTASNVPLETTPPDPTLPPPVRVSNTIGTPATLSGTPSPGVAGTDYGYQFALGGLPTPQTIVRGNLLVDAGSLPPGLVLDRTGYLHGTPTTTGAFTFTVDAENGVLATYLTVTLTIVARPGSPTITAVSPTVSSATVAFTTNATDPAGTKYTAVATPTGGGAAVRSAPATSSPITVSGLAGGTSYQFVVEASTLSGAPAATSTSDASPAIRIGVTPTITTDRPAVAAVGSAGTYSYIVTGDPTPTLSISAGTLPPGLSFDPFAGVVSGTPTTSGRYTFTVLATNSFGSASTTTTFTVIAPPGSPKVEAVSASDASAEVRFNPGAEGFPTDTTYRAVATPPSGPSVTSSTSTGSPIVVTGLSNGTDYRFTVTATNTTGSSTSTPSGPVTIGVGPSIAGAPPAGAVKTSYRYTYALGGAPAAATTVTAGALPPGLTLDAAGNLTGTPTAAGSYTFTVNATNPLGSASVSTTLIITQATTARTDVAVTLTAPSSTNNRLYTYDLAVRNQGPADASNVVTVFTLPRGVSVQSVSGSPARIGRALVWPALSSLGRGQSRTYTVTVRAVDTGSKTAVGMAGSQRTPDTNYQNNIASVTTVVRN